MTSRCLYTLIALLAVSSARGAYTNRIDIVYGWEKGVPSRLVPVDSGHYLLRQPNGFLTEIGYTPFEMFQLRGPRPWVGEIEGDNIVMYADPRTNRDRGVLIFEGGRLKLAKRKNRIIRPPQGKAVDSLDSLWPDVSGEIEADRRNHGAIWRNDRRLKLGLDNPNDTGIVLAFLTLILLAAVLFSSGRVMRLSAAVAMVFALGGMLMTGSRGALLSLLLGAVPELGAFVATRRRWCPSSGRARAAIAVAALLLVAGIVILAHGERFTTGLFEQGGEDSRIPIFAQVPNMIADAPGGWGWNDSGHSYVNWYGQLENRFVIRGLIGSHMTMMTELGDCGRVAYGFFWFSALLLAFAARRRSSLPFAVLLSFFASAFLNPVLFCPVTWIIPLVAFAYLVKVRPWSRRTLWGCLLLGLLLSGAVLAALKLAGGSHWNDRYEGEEENSVPVRRDGRAVVVGGGEPVGWVVDDSYHSYALSGFYYPGREMRAYYFVHRGASPVGYVRSYDDLPKGADAVMIAGRSCVDFIRKWKSGELVDPPSRVILLSPPFSPSEVPTGLLKAVKITLVTGEFAAECWKDGERVPPWAEIVPGCELYIPDWMSRIAVRPSAKEGK